MGQFCRKCGASLAEDSSFCEACGTKVSEAPQPTAHAIASPVANRRIPSFNSRTIAVGLIGLVAIVLIGGALLSRGSSGPKPYATAEELATDLESHGLCDNRSEMPGVWADTEASCKAHGNGMNIFVNEPGTGVASTLDELNNSMAATDFGFDSIELIGPNWVVSTVASEPGEGDFMKEVQAAIGGELRE